MRVVPNVFRTSLPVLKANWQRRLFVLWAITVSLGGVVQTRADEATLRPGDKIRLEIKGVPDYEKLDINGEYTIGEEGTIPLPYISNPHAAGEKPSILARKIEQAYRSAEIYTNPTIVINADSDASQRVVSVTGGVTRNGALNYYDGMTLLDAISQSGGLTDFAKQKDVKVIRGQQVSVHNLDAVIRDTRLNITLRPGDNIVVPESGRKL